MSFQEALTQQPQWVQLWSNWLFVGAFLLPLTLAFWKQGRVIALVTLIATIAMSLTTYWIFLQLGFVRLLGLGHLPFWIPLAYYFYQQIKRQDMPTWPHRILMIALATISISLIFDTIDVARYILGERDVMAKPLP